MGQPSDRSLVPLMCAAGAAALVGQTLLIRELMVSFYGTELALALVLSCWLMFVALGALAAAAVLKAVRRELLLAYLALGAMAVGLHAQFLLGRLVRPLLGADAGEFLSVRSMLAGTVLAAFPVAFTVGFFFPVASRFEERRAFLPAAGISRLYVAEAIGSAAAGALLSFYLLGGQTPTEIVFGTSVILVMLAGLGAAGAGRWLCLAAGGFLIALFCWSGSRQQIGLFFGLAPLMAAAGCAVLVAGRRRRFDLVASTAFVVMGLAVCVAFLGWGGALRRATVHARWNTFSRFRLIAGRDTRYQHIELGEREGDFVLVQNGYRTAQFPDPRVSRARAALLLTQHRRPRDLLVIGGGLGGLCQELLKSPIASLDYVEADPQLVTLLYDNLPAELRGPLADSRFAAYGCDGRYFVRRSAREPAALTGKYLPLGGRAEGRAPAAAYDLAVVNLGDPTSASASRFYTVEFCRELRDILRPEGAVAFCGIAGSANYVRGTAVLDYTACVYRTLRSVFQSVVVRPGEEFCFFGGAGPGVVSADPQVLMGRFDALGLQPPMLKYGFELAEFPPERTEWATGLLEEAAPTALLNTDARPVVFTLFLRLQAHYARASRGVSARGRLSGGEDVFGRVRSARPLWFWLPFAVLLVTVVMLRAGLGARRATPWACGFSIFTTGFFGLSAEMLIVYGYQTSFGYVYRDISIIVGLFMLGLALGGWLMNRWAVVRPDRHLLIVECVQAVVILALPLAGRGLSFSPYAFMLLSPVAGFLTGSEFPLAARISLASGREAGTVAGIFDAADHLGALAGAALAGLLLVPALGVVQSAALLALMKCVSLVGLLLVFVRSGPRTAAP